MSKVWRSNQRYSSAFPISPTSASDKNSASPASCVTDQPFGREFTDGARTGRFAAMPIGMKMTNPARRISRNSWSSFICELGREGLNANRIGGRVALTCDRNRIQSRASCSQEFRTSDFVGSSYSPSPQPRLPVLKTWLVDTFPSTPFRRKRNESRIGSVDLRDDSVCASFIPCRQHTLRTIYTSPPFLW